jgi:ATP-dependent DNA helicase RecQ
VEQLNARGIPATFINSSLSDLERSERLRRLRAGEYRLLYVSPERLRLASFLELLKSLSVQLFAIDEAHCISQWGHDFRPDYAALGQVRKALRPPRTVALTATATPEVQADIAKSLLMKDPRVFVAGFDRPNLFLEVIPVSGDEDRRAISADWAKRAGSGIIYCSTRKSAESLHQSLTRKGHASVLYHAGLDEKERQRAQDEFMAKEKVVAVATNAFGMGIDKPNIRYVLHAHIPRAVESYYQEIGRAGRDGNPAHAVLLFNHADVFTQQRLVEGNHPDEPVFADIWTVLRSYGEPYAKGQQALAAAIGGSEFEVSAALKILEREGFLERGLKGEGRYGVQLLPRAAAAQPHSPLAQKLLALLPGLSKGSAPVTFTLPWLSGKVGATEAECRRALGLLEKAAAIRVSRPFAGRALRLLRDVPFGELGFDIRRVQERERRALALLKRMTDYAYSKRCRRAFVLGYFGEESEPGGCASCDVCVGAQARPPTKRLRTVATPPPEAPAGGFSELAAMELTRFRKELAQELGLAPFHIFNNETLRALATALPIGREEFLAVKGTGERHWERFGPKVVETCLMARAAGHIPRAVPRVRKARKTRSA